MIEIIVKPVTGGWRLFTKGDCGIQPAGDRLLRLNAPLVQYFHEKEEEAIRDAVKLELHVNEYAKTKESKKTNHGRTV